VSVHDGQVEDREVREGDEVRDGMVEIREEFYRRDGQLRHRISCDSQTLYDSIAINFFYNIAHPDPRGVVMMYDPKAKYAWWDGSCLVTALVKEGPKAIVKWRGPCTTL
jgi:hypothetical protein